MNKLLFLIATCVVLASAITIDDFDVQQTGAYSVNVGVTASSSVSGANILGGERDLAVVLLTDNTPDTNDGAEILVAGDLQLLKLSVDSACTAIGQVQWDGPDGSPNFSVTGLGGIDMTFDGGNAIRWLWISSDIPSRAVIEVHDMSGAVGNFTYNNPGAYNSQQATNLELVIPYTAFSASLDWTRIGAMRIVFTSPGPVDLQVSLLETVPLTTFSKTANVTSLSAGQRVGFSVSISNEEDVLGYANTFTVSDVLDPMLRLVVGSVRVEIDGVPFTGASISQGNNAGDTSVTVSGEMNDGNIVVVYFVASLPSAMSCSTSSVTNTAMVRTDLIQSNTNTVTLQILGNTDVNLTSTLDSNTNGVVSYSLRTCNIGSREATNVVFSASVPSNVALVQQNGWSCQGASCTLTTGMSVAPGACLTRGVSYNVVNRPCGTTPVNPTFTVTQDCGGIETETTTGPSFNIVGASSIDFTLTSTPTVGPGSLIIATICATNTGSSNSSGADFILRYNSSVVTPPNSANGRCINGVCTFRIEAINVGAAPKCVDTEFMVNAQLTCLQTVARFNASSTDLCTSSTLQRTVSTVLNGAPSLTLTKTFAGSAAILPGGLVPFDHTVCNNGNRQAVGVVIRETYTAQMTPEGALVSVCSAGVCNVTVGNLNANQCQTVRANFRLANVVECAQGNITVPATVRETCTSASASATAMFAINASPFFTISKNEQAGDETARPGEQIVYDITFSNTGNRIAENVVLTESYSQYTSPVVNQQGWTCNTSSRNCTYSRGRLAPADGQVSISFAVTVVNPIPSNVDDLVNTATISSAGPCAANATTSTDTPILANPDLIITKTLVSQQPVQAGQQVVFQFNYWNMGDVAAEGVQIIDTLPQYLTVAQGNTGWNCTVTQCTYNVGTLEPVVEPRTATLTFNVNMPLPCGVNSTTNTVRITDNGAQGPDTDMTNNSDSETVSLAAVTELQLELTAFPTTVYAGDEVCFNASYRNAGPRTARNVVYSFYTPDYLTFSGTGYSCVNRTLGILCTSTTVISSVNSADDDRNARVCFTVDAQLPAGVESTTFDAAVTEDCTADQAVQSVTVLLVAAPDLKVCKSGRISRISYSVDVFNHGSRGAEGVTITENIPAGTTFNAELSDPRWDCSAAPTCTLQVGVVEVRGADSARFVVNLDQDIEECTVFDNTAVADLTNGPDLNPQDNEDSVTFTVCPGNTCDAPEAGACVCSIAPIVIPPCECNCQYEEPVECVAATCESQFCSGCPMVEPEEECCGGGSPTTINFSFGETPSTCQ